MGMDLPRKTRRRRTRRSVDTSELESPDWRELTAQATFWRTFNRYYFNRLRKVRGINNGWGFHPTELRVLREIGEAESGASNSYIAWKVNVDRGQVSRIIAFFRHLGWIEDERCPEDRRVKYFRLTPAGRHTFGGLDKRCQDATELFLTYMVPEDRVRLVRALSEVQGILAQISLSA